MTIRKTLIILCCIIILLLFGLVASISYSVGKDYGVTNAEKIREENSKKEQAHLKSVKSVLATKVKNTKIKNKLSSTGRVVSVNNITISSEVQGRLVNNTFKKGTEIRKGEVIFSVKNTELKLLVEAKKSRFMSLISANMADINLDFNNEFTKWNNFFNAIDINSDLPIFPQINTTKEKNYIISRSILSQYLALKSDEEKLRKYIVRAPFDGIITKSYSDIGANVNPGTPIVDFIRKDEMEIELTVSTNEIDFINIGDKVNFKDNKKIYIGQITRKGGFVNANTQNISVFSSINADVSTLYNGMYVDAKIITQLKDDVFRIPSRAIFNNNKVFKIGDGNKLEIGQVNIIAYQEDAVIVDNLEDNTIIVKEPLVNMSEGTIVNPVIK
jgi:multidrug efflux pump subunit AcrA (membrane-fusion protein)